MQRKKCHDDSVERTSVSLCDAENNTTTTRVTKTRKRIVKTVEKSSLESHSSICSCGDELYVYCSLGDLWSVKHWLSRHCVLSENLSCCRQQQQQDKKQQQQIDNNISKTTDQANNDNGCLCTCPMQGNVWMVKIVIMRACIKMALQNHMHIILFLVEQHLIDEETNVYANLGTTTFFEWLIQHSHTNNGMDTHVCNVLDLFVKLYCAPRLTSFALEKAIHIEQMGILWCNDMFERGDEYHILINQWLCHAIRHANLAVIKFCLYQHQKQGMIKAFDYPLKLIHAMQNVFCEECFLADANLVVYRYLLTTLGKYRLTYEDRKKFGDLITMYCIGSNLFDHVDIACAFMKTYYFAWRDAKPMLWSGTQWVWQKAWTEELCGIWVNAAGNKSNQTEILNVLKQHGATQLPLYSSIVQQIMSLGHIDNIRWLLENKPYLLDHQLNFAIRTGRLSIVKLLLSFGRSIVFNKSDALTIALSERNPINMCRVSRPDIAQCLVEYRRWNMHESSESHFIVEKYLDEKNRLYFCLEFLAQNMEALDKVIRVLDNHYRSQTHSQCTRNDGGNCGSVSVFTYSLDTTFMLVVLRDIVLRQLYVDFSNAKETLIS